MSSAWYRFTLLTSGPESLESLVARRLSVKKIPQGFFFLWKILYIHILVTGTRPTTQMFKLCCSPWVELYFLMFHSQTRNAPEISRHGKTTAHEVVWLQTLGVQTQVFWNKCEWYPTHEAAGLVCWSSGRRQLEPVHQAVGFGVSVLFVFRNYKN